VRLDREIGIVDAGREIVEALEDDRPPLGLEQGRVGGGAFQDGAVRSHVAEQGHEPAFGRDRFRQRPDDGAIDVRGLAREALAERLAGDGHAIEVEEILQFA
jgi:hypothetical protein